MSDGPHPDLRIERAILIRMLDTPGPDNETIEERLVEWGRRASSLSGGAGTVRHAARVGSNTPRRYGRLTAPHSTGKQVGWPLAWSVATRVPSARNSGAHVAERNTSNDEVAAPCPRCAGLRMGPVLGWYLRDMSIATLTSGTEDGVGTAHVH
jgi:hypothetical protein